MKRLVPVGAQQKARKTVPHLRTRKVKYHWLPKLNRRYAVVAAAAVCGLILAYTHLLPSLPDKPSQNSSNTVIKKSSPVKAPPVLGPLQNNPLFSAAPSWAQDFSKQSSGAPDAQYWNTLAGPADNDNNEQQYYTANNANVRIENGALRLIATHQAEPQGYHYGSARLETQGKKSFLYGRIDVTAKLPSGSGSWPAIWLLPDNDKYARNSPANYALRWKNGGELDVMEAVGFQPNIIYGVAHTASDTSQHPDGTGSYNTVIVPTSATGFNTYTLLWTPTSVTFAVNNAPYFTYARPVGANYTTWPFDQPFYIILNLAMGGSWGGMDTMHFPGNGIDNSALPSSLDIQSIYYYPYTGSTAVQ